MLKLQQMSSNQEKIHAQTRSIPKYPSTVEYPQKLLYPHVEVPIALSFQECSTGNPCLHNTAFPPLQGPIPPTGIVAVEL